LLQYLISFKNYKFELKSTFFLSELVQYNCIGEHGFGAKAIRANYLDKNWSLSTLQTICRRVDETYSAVTRRAGSGRSKSVLLQMVNILKF